MTRQADSQVGRTRVAGRSERGAREALFLFALLAVALLLGQSTLTARAQGPTPPTGAQEATPSTSDVGAAHLSPDGCTELIINGGFEVTDLHWALSGTLQPPSYSTTKAFAGERSMRLGIVDSGNQDASDGLYQDIALPDSAQHFTLSFHYWPIHEAAPGGDAQTLSIYEATTGVRLAQPWSRLSNTQTWQFEQIDLTHLRGRTLRIEFGVLNDGSGGRTALYLDDVSLLACEADATPFVTPTAPSAQPGATPQPVTTRQPVATPLPGGCVESDALKNGDFEEVLNDWSNWAVGRSPTPPILSDQRSEGAWSLRLGNPPGTTTQNSFSYSSVRQLIQLPADASSASLRWSHLSRTQEQATLSPAISSDRQELILLTSSLETEAILFRKRTESTIWATETVDLTPFLGGSYHLYFNVYNDGNGSRTWMYLDDVAVNLCYGSAAAPSADRGASAQQPDKSAVAQPDSPTPATEEAGATPTPPVRGTIIAVGMSTPSAITQRSNSSARPADVASVTVWQRFRRISQTAQGQTFLFLLLIVLAAIGYLRFRESRRSRP